MSNQERVIVEPRTVRIENDTDRAVSIKVAAYEADRRALDEIVAAFKKERHGDRGRNHCALLDEIEWAVRNTGRVI